MVIFGCKLQQCLALGDVFLFLMLEIFWVCFALLFGQCKLWNLGVCCINWGVINALGRTTELSDSLFDIEISK